MNPRPLGYEPYDPRLWRLGLSFAGAMTSTDGTDHISIRREPAAWPQPGLDAAADETLLQRGRTTVSLVEATAAQRIAHLAGKASAQIRD